MQFPFEGVPGPGECTEVAPGVLWLRMPLPYALNHINLWAIRDGEGWAVVDSGVNTPETVKAWRAVMAGPFEGLPITRVICTHMHPDHVGMAGWLTRRFKCPLFMTRLEYLTCRVLVADTGREAPAEAIQFFHRAGWSEESLEDYRARFGGFGRDIHALPENMERLSDNDVLMIGNNEWHIVVGNGHSPEHACLYCPALELLISGDQVLPRISSNVSVFPTEPAADPLGDWITSIAKLRQKIPDSVLVLPSHNEPFRGLHARLDALDRGHQVALTRLLKRLDEPRLVVDTFIALFARKIEGGSGLLGMATGEAVAHLNHLIKAGQVEVNYDEDDLAWYSLKQ
ncbi:MAG: MBL fold metallo-hydrolase [Burkholderiaceae bacterium]